MTLKTMQRSGVPSGFQKRRLSALLNRLSLTALGWATQSPGGCDQQQGGFWHGGTAVAGRITVPGSQRGSTKSRARSQRGLFSGFKISLSLPGFHETHPSFPLSHFFLLEGECLSFASPTAVLWKQLPYLVSLIHSWRGVLRPEEPHPYLIEMIFGKNFGL